ncbi:MAG: phage head closure protein [Christensenella sp.]|nr:phage head closure protein [Christensenella sp.]
MRTDWVTLIKTAVTESTFQQITPVSSVSCWANQKSVVRSEFYAADANGRTVDAVFEVSPIDYAGQQLVHHAAGGDVEYKIVRDYKIGQDTVELVCTRITE